MRSAARASRLRWEDQFNLGLDPDKRSSLPKFAAPFRISALFRPSQTNFCPCRAALEENVFGSEVTFSFIDGVINDLLTDMIPPIRIQERAAMKGVLMRLDLHVRLALQLLPMAGRFLKASSDAIYSAEFRPKFA